MNLKVIFLLRLFNVINPVFKTEISKSVERKVVFLFPQGTAGANNISATPTFLFFRNRVRVDQYQGADAAGLEEKIKQHTENDPGNNEDSDIPKGYVSLLHHTGPGLVLDYPCRAKISDQSLKQMFLSKLEF